MSFRSLGRGKQRRDSRYVWTGTTSKVWEQPKMFLETLHRASSFLFLFPYLQHMFDTRQAGDSSDNTSTHEPGQQRQMKPTKRLLSSLRKIDRKARNISKERLRVYSQARWFGAAQTAEISKFENQYDRHTKNNFPPVDAT